MLGLLAITVVYEGLHLRWHASGRRSPWWRWAAFHLATLATGLALLSPLDGLADTDLFSVHMLQHVLLTFVAPPLWLLGIPRHWVNHLQANRLYRWAANRLGSPLFAYLVFNGVMWAWHWPSAYDAALASEPLHIVEHLCFIASALVGWLPIFGGLLPEARRLAPPMRGLYAVALIPPCTALAALITFSGHQLYAFYGQRALEWGLNPMLDQTLGGLVMWMPTDVIFLGVALRIFGRWLSADRTAPQSLPVSVS